MRGKNPSFAEILQDQLAQHADSNPTFYLDPSPRSTLEEIMIHFETEAVGHRPSVSRVYPRPRPKRLAAKPAPPLKSTLRLSVSQLTQSESQVLKELYELAPHPLGPEISLTEVKRVFRMAAKRFHPDRLRDPLAQQEGARLFQTATLHYRVLRAALEAKGKKS